MSHYIFLIDNSYSMNSYLYSICNIVNKFNEKILRLHWMDNGIEKNIINNTNICIGTIGIRLLFYLFVL